MHVTRVEAQIGSATLSLETGKLAKQAHGSVFVNYGETTILVAAVEGSARPGQDFFPLTIEYREKTYAAGKFPGGFIKRETRPSLKETLTSRLIDRPLRPLFPTDYFNEIQVMCMVLSYDRENDPDVMALNGASAALHISPVPFQKPVGAVRVGRVDGKLVMLPTQLQMEESDLDLIVAGTRDDITMIEGFAREMPEDDMTTAILFAHAEIVKIVDLIEEFRTKMGLPAKVPHPAAPVNPLVEVFHKKYGAELKTRKQIKPKLERQVKVAELRKQIVAENPAPEGDKPAFTAAHVTGAISTLEEIVFREITLSGSRIDGRGYREIRPLFCEVGMLPRAHGSAVFQRGETQALLVTTLGTVADEQKVDGLSDEYSKKFMLDYNFPSFSVGECKPFRAPGRRELGHGALAERSLKAVIPPSSKFPYTIRLVSEILESNGSSSMATVCGGTLSLMDAGVPIKDPVAGISVGLVKTSNTEFALLTDIQGDEDHYGDMDFKIAGTQRGITGIQLDIKVDGINEAIIRGALEQAKEARRELLKAMLTTLRMPRSAISMNAPRMLQTKIDPSKIGLLIGPGGKNIKGIQEATGAKIDIEEDGTVFISHSDAAGAEEAKRRVESITQEVQVGRTYDGKVTSVKEFGAFIEILPGREGLCHISDLDTQYVSRVEDVVRVGDKFQVKVISIDDQDRVKVSRKALLAPPADGSEPAPSGPRPERQDRGGGGGGGDRGDRRGGGGGGSGGGGRGGDRGDRRR